MKCRSVVFGAVALIACAQTESTNPVDPAQELGGQTGDDGDVVDQPEPVPAQPPTPFPTPGMPPLDGCEPRERELEIDQQTVFGADSAALVARLSASRTAFHWLAYNEVPGTSYQPGPGETRLDVAVEVVDDGVVVEHARVPSEENPDERCASSTVEVPVSVLLDTDDGALRERFQSTLTFTGPYTASFEHELSVDDVAGSMHFLEIGTERPEQEWEVEGLSFDVSLWPGGSRGEIRPNMRLTNPPEIAEPPEPTPPPSTPPSTEANELVVPDYRPFVASWPFDRVCRRGGDPVAPDAQIKGFSIDDVVAAMRSVEQWPVRMDGSEIPLQFEVEAPSEVVCMVSGSRPEELVFEVRATLSALSEPAPSTGDAGAGDAGTTSSEGPLSRLSVTAVYDVFATSHPTEPYPETLHFVRRTDDTVHDLTRQELATATGLSLEVNDEYQRFWWTWQGKLRMASDTAPPQGIAELLVTSLNAEQAAALDAQQASGGPGASVGLDGQRFAVLPGDELLRAEMDTTEQ